MVRVFIYFKQNSQRYNFGALNNDKNYISLTGV